MKMTKREIQNIIAKDWQERRAKNIEDSKTNSERAKQWKLQERINKNKKVLNLPRTARTTLSLLVSVTYAREY